MLELQLNFQSFVANDLPMASLTNDLKQGIRVKGLACHQALAINKLSAKNLNQTEDLAIKTRAKVVEQVISQHLSVRKTRDLVTSVLEQHNSQISQKPQKFVTKYVNYIADMEVSRLSQEDKAVLIEALEAKLAKLRLDREN